MAIAATQKILLSPPSESWDAVRACPFLQPCVLASEKNFRAYLGALALHIFVVLSALLLWQELRPPQVLSNPLLAVPVMFTAPTSTSDNMTDQRAATTPPQLSIPKAKTAPKIQPSPVSADSVPLPTASITPPPTRNVVAANAAGSSGEFRGLPLDQAADYATAPVPPVYPSASIANDEQGQTIIRARVVADGTVAEVMVWQSSGFARLDRAALAAVREWRFMPARQGFTARAAWVDVPVDFVLR